MPTLPVFTKQYRSPESLILDLASLCPIDHYLWKFLQIFGQDHFFGNNSVFHDITMRKPKA